MTKQEALDIINDRLRDQTAEEIANDGPPHITPQDERDAFNAVIDYTDSAISLNETTSGLGYDVFILMGESGMVGRAEEFDALMDFPSDKVYEYGRNAPYDGKIIQATHPLHHNDTSQAANDIGCGLEFAKWYATTTGRKILLICTAQGGSAFNGNWAAGTGSLYTDALSRANAVLADPNNQLKAVLGEIGSNDAINGGVVAFSTNLSDFITQFRADLSVDASQTPFLFSGLADEWYTGNTDRQSVQTVLEGVNNLDANSFYVDGDNLPSITGDPVHKNGESLRILGLRFFERYLIESIKDTSAPSKILNVIASPLDMSIQVDWASDLSASSYNLEYKLSSDTTWTVISSITSNSHLITGLTNGSSYDVRVQGVNNIGAGDYSDVSTTTPDQGIREADASFHGIFGNGAANANNPDHRDINGTNPLTVSGDPLSITSSSNFITIGSGLNGLLSDSDDAPNQFVLAVVRTSGDSVLFGTYTQTEADGGSLLFTSANIMYANHRGINQEIIENPAGSDWIICGYSITGGTDGFNFSQKVGSTLTIDPMTGNKTIATPQRKVSIGRPYYSATALADSADFAEFIVIDSYKNQTQIQDIVTRTIQRLNDVSGIVF